MIRETTCVIDTSSSTIEHGRVRFSRTSRETKNLTIVVLPLNKLALTAIPQAIKATKRPLLAKEPFPETARADSPT